jgi:hypothetical protein
VKLSLHFRRDGLAAVLSLTLLLFFSGTLRAATLDDYRARLSRVVAFLETFHGASNQSGHSSAQEVASANLDFVREQLPAQETIHFQDRTIAVDNSWLEDELKEYGTSVKAADRASTVSRITERLKSIQEQVRALQNAATPPGDKDADKGRLAEILRRPEYITHVEPQGNALERLIERILRWLEKLLPKWKPMQPGSSRFVAQAAQIIVIAVCIGAIALLVWRYGPRLVSGRRKKKKKREARIVLGERLEPDQTAADLLAQAEALAREGNLRAAIRKAYIALLCELGDRKLVSLAEYKTNRDYLNAVRDKGSLYTSMRKLTNMFELHWYGFVPAGDADWDEFRNGYKKIFRSDQ